MKIGNFNLAARAIAARQAMVTQRDHGAFGVTIDGRYQDEETVEAVRPVIVARINRQIAELDADLVALGIDLS